MVYSPMESLVGHLRGTQDVGNGLAAASVTGILYKSTGVCVCVCVLVLD